MISIHGSNILFHLLTLPFLARSLGTDAFGHVAFIMSVLQVSVLFSEYGFHITGSKKIAESPDNHDDIVKCIISAKLILVFLFSIVFILYITIADARILNLALWAIVPLVGQSIDPLFYFIGSANIRKMAPYSVAFRIIAALSIIIFISSPGDAWVYFFANGLSWVCADLVGFYFLRRSVGLSLSFRKGLCGLREGWQVFQAHLSGNIFDLLLPTVLLVAAQATAVSYFVASDKMVRAVWGVLQPLRMVLFPRMAYLVAHERPKARLLLAKASFVLCGISLIASVLLFLFAAETSKLFYGLEFGLPVQLVQVMSPLPFLLAANNMIGLQWLIAIGEERLFKWLMVGCGVWRLGGCFLLAKFYAETGAAIAVISAELFILLGCLFLFWRSLSVPPPPPCVERGGEGGP